MPWRYENVANRVALRDSGKRELDEQAEWCREREKEEDAVILELKNAEKDVAATGEISQQLKQRIFAMMPGFESIWSEIETATQENLNEPAALSKMFRKLSPAERSSMVASIVVKREINFLEQLRHWRYSSVTEIATGQQVIPDREVLDKILRYGTMTERNLGACPRSTRTLTKGPQRRSRSGSCERTSDALMRNYETKPRSSLLSTQALERLAECPRILSSHCGA
jgi:hypothetical protein